MIQPLSLRELSIVETLLRNRRDFFVEIREGVGVRDKIRAMLLSCVVFLAAYGAVMGGAHSVFQSLASAVKVPVLFLATLAICVPSLHYFNILFGSRQTIEQTLALILTAVSTTSVLLFSLAPITLFFLLTSPQYEFFKLLNVAFFALAGGLGIAFLRLGMRIVTESEGDAGVGSRRTVFFIWVLLYGFVGSQMAWTLRPFLGDPTKEFILFIQLGGNIYADIARTLAALLGF